MIDAVVVTGGHPFAAEPFADLLDALDGVRCRHVAHPDALDVFSPNGLGSADVLVCYDMPGLRFRPGADPELIEPSRRVVDGWAELLAAGIPVVLWHHAIASWPAWAGFADIAGGRFHYVPGRLHGMHWPDSGYRHDVEQTLTVVDPTHPVCDGLPAQFRLVDETYLCPVFDDALTPLLTTDAPRTDRDHFSARLAVNGRRGTNDGWSHPPGTTLAAWTHVVDRSTVVYVQPGDGPSSYANPHVRRLIGNAVTWAADTRSGS